MSQELSQWLERQLEQQGLTASTLSYCATLSEDTILSILEDHRVPVLRRTCLKLAAYFKVPPDHLYRLAGLEAAPAEGEASPLQRERAG